MGNKCKRFLTMLLMAVLLICAMSMNVMAAETDTTELECYTFGDVNGDDVIDQKDAIYLLYHATLGEDMYPLNGRDGDMDGDGDIDKDDAIHLLFHTFPAFAQNYPLAKEGTIHAYFAPVWTWNVTDGESKCMAATVTVKCACGQELSGTVDAYPADAKAATCTEDGYEKYSETITVGGIDYAGTYEVVLPATGHNVTATCTGEASCENGCGYTVAALGHSWEEISKTEATCGEDGEKVSKCSACGEEKTEVLPATGAHSYGDEEVVEVDGKDCTFVKVKTCTVCGDEVSSSEYEAHSYTDTVTVTHATCTEKGEKVYTCDNCDSTKTEEIPVNPEAHNWQTEDGSHFTCACGASKDVVAVENGADVNAADMSDTELALAEGTALALDGDSVENLPAEQVQVSVENVAGEGETPVYDFNMTYVDENGETQPVSQFSGTVTVTLPYELGEDEDPESVAVLYINGDGETETIYAIYANGYITFTTNHFSYYTVTRLSPAERCALYGHKYGKMPLTREATCTEEGYTYLVCQRCAHVSVQSTTEAKGHSYVRTTTAATCIEAGKHTDVCSDCGHTVVEEIPATGHAYKLTEDSVAPDCTTSGKNVYKCDTCGDSYEEVVEALGHAYGDVETKPASCEENGYQKHTCGTCGHEEILAEYSAKGHRFPTSDEEDADVKPEWEWVWEGEELVDVTVEIHCVEDGCEYTRTLTAVVTEEDETGCEGGDVTYYAKAGYNGHGFEHPPYKKHKEGEGHKHGDKWHTDAVKHYHKCSTCKEIYDSAAHNWDEGTVITEATCVDKGQTVYKCTVCGYEKTETVEATGKHDLQDGVCSVCGYETNDCDHYRRNQVQYDLSEYGACGGKITAATCDCGQNAYPWDYYYDCEMVETSEKRTNDNGITYTVWIYTCEECGLVMEQGYCEYISEDPCEAGFYEITRFMIDGELITGGESSGVYESHPTHWNNEFEIIDLTKYGLCNEILEKRTCPCGERTWHYGESRCNWEYSEGSVMEDGVYEICTDCGAKRLRQYDEEIDEENCSYLWVNTVTYYVNDEEVYSYINEEQHEWHTYTISNVKVHGDNCEEDGISYDMTCVVCGETGTHHEYWHMPINTTVMDLSGYDICFDMAYQSTCACELAYREGGLEGQNYCDWLPLYEGINKSAEYCSVCGATRTQTTTVSQPDENCLVKETTKYDIADKNGKHIVTYYNDYYTTAHEYETVYTLKGDTCEDGVEITNTCINCGDSYTNYRTWCNVETVETVDLSGLGGCITRVERYSCPCGQNAGLWYYYGSSSCSTTLIDKGQGYEIRECRYCGIRQETRWTEEAVDSCHSKVKYTVTFSKDGKSKSVSYEQFAENHEIVYDLQLVEDATDCTGGYTIAEVCQKCDYRREYSGTRYTHNAYEVEKKRLDNGELCGEFYLVTVSCACGQESWTRTQWGKDNCDWSGYYSEELGCEVWECQDCGAIRYSERTETPVEGTCNVEIFEHIVYMKDGKELFSYDESYTSSRHAYVYDFNLYGESCTDGYDYTATCADCGATASGEGYYGHSWWATWRKIEHEDLCSTFYLQMGGCACGRDNGYGWNASCNFDWQYDEALDRYCNKCNECGLIMMQEEDYAATDDPCIWNSDREYSFYLNGEKLDSFTTSCAEEHHSWVYDFNLLGATCDDGYTYTQTCKFCGAYEDHSNDTHYGCSWWTMDQVMVYDSDDICGSIRYYSDGCACGKLSSNWTNYSCSFNHHWDEELERYVNECVDCGLVWMTDETRDEPDESCTVTVTRVNTFMLDGEVVGTSTNVTTEKSHDWHYEFNLQGETCEDGYTVTSVCNRCGQRNEGDHLYYDHDSWRTGEIEIHNGEGSCGKLVIYPYTCACGRNQGFDWSHDCSFSGYWEDNRTVVYECEYCDLNYTRTESYGVADENCDRTVTYDYVFKLGEEVLKTLSYTDTNKEHRWTREFTLLGQFCKDGYTMNSVCTRCGYREDSDHIYYGCESRTMGDYQVIYENENLCGPVYVESYRCACGLHSGYEIRTTCDSYEYWDDKEGWVYGCDDCDLKYQLDWNEFISEGENCVWQYKSHYTFHIGEETFEYSYNFQYPNHTWVYEYEMVEGGTSCEDGYYRIRTCADCGYADSRDGIYTGHDTNCVEYYDLADYGLCGGEIYLYSCACGENSYISWREDCDKEYTGNTDEATGAQERYCADCGTYTYYLSEGGFNRPACRTEYRFYYQAVHDDETQLLLDKNTGETRHTYVAKDYALNEGATDCEGGYTGRYECIYCGYGYTFSSNGHDTRPVEFIDLSDYDVCDSANYLEQRVCACGMYQDFSYNVCDNFSWYDNWTEDDENGNEHYYEVGKCDECGLEILWHQYVDLEDGSCDGTFYRYYTVTLGDSLNKTLVRSYPTTSHDWGEPVYTLYEDSVVCTDGIWSTRYCQREGCGATTRTGYGPAGHYFMNVTDSIDLAQYGSICGETLDYLECPCGAEYRWNFDNQNHCDLDQKSTDIEWLNEVIQRENLGEKVVDTAQYTSEGWVDSYSNAYIFTCAVTDPEACGLKVRMAEYWVKNGCEVTEYQTWQLGYDADTGECQYEFTVTTGDKHAYHDYEYSDADEYDENGRYTLDVDLDLCPDCGSYYKRQWFYEDGDHVKTERERVNTLDNGEMKRYYELYEYGEEQTYEHNGETGSFRYQTLSRSEYTYADGSEYWSQYAYTYNFQDACLRTYEYTNSDGGYDTGTDTCHNGYWDREDIEQPTCTQFGSWREWHTCYVCGEITDEYTYNYMPVAHYWYWNSEKETYVCSVCELENINGASGVVVMEDLTDDENWGSDTDYVIGYWNRENVQFTVELSVIFNDRDENHEDGNQFVLTGIEIADHTKENDGFVGKSFNKAAAIEAAEAKMEEQGYTGSFSIRINFVPANDDTDLDYAITFDPIEVGGDAEAEEETTEPVEEEAATEPDYSNMEEAPDDIFDF